MATHSIKVNRKWDSESVRIACIKSGLYTRGTCREYDNMLNMVDRLYPDLINLRLIAEDIKDHSEDQTVSNVMFLLERMAVITTFEIDGEE